MIYERCANCVNYVRYQNDAEHFSKEWCEICKDQALPPYEHQYKDFVRFRDNPAFALFWEMGTGKTKETIDIAVHKYKQKTIDKVLIIAPNTVHEQWINKEIPKHCVVPYSVFTYYNKNTEKYLTALFNFLEQSQDKSKLHFLAVHVEAFQYPKIETTIKRYAAGAKLLWVVDEGTRIKNIQSKTHKNIVNYANKYGGCRTLLTGTALAKNPLDVYGMTEFIRPGYLGMSYTAFQCRHAVMMKQRVEYIKGGVKREIKIPILLNEGLFWKVKREIKSILTESHSLELTYLQVISLATKYELAESDIKFIADSETFTRFKNLEPLKAQLSPIASMRRKVDCVQLPEKVYEEISFELNKEQKRVINQMKEYAVALYGDKELTIVQKQALQIRALQVCGGFFPYVKDVLPDDSCKYAVEKMKERNAKLEYLKDDIEELGGESFIVWAVFTEELNMLCAELNKITSVGLLSGAVNMSTREEVVADFLAGKLQGLVANPQVAGYGLNFQRAGYQYWYSRNYRTEARLQAEDRSHRIGIVRSPVYKDLVYNCAFEKKVLEDNKNGRQMNDYFNNSSISELFTI